MRVVLSPEALGDITSIIAFIAEDNPTAASALRDRLGAGLRQIEQFPQSAPENPDFPGVRELAVGSYVICYEIRADMVGVLRVFHAAQDRDQLL